MIRKAILYYNTLRFLKWTQIRYQLWYKVRKLFRSFAGHKYVFDKKTPSFKKLSMIGDLAQLTSYTGNNHFRFLNINHEFHDKIDWDFAQYGKLWTYNLNYFEFLNQSDAKIYKDHFYEIIFEFISNLPKLKNANEPFPTSLRVINWVKYFIKNENIEDQFLLSLYNQLYILNDNKEFHLMGNHLLENGFALVLGGVFFQDKYIYNQGKAILIEQLEEQILNDGAHFELSPMYHCLMLQRLLDTINIFHNNKSILEHSFGKQDQFLLFIQNKAVKMCEWLLSVMYEDGSLPHFNDSTDGIAIKPLDLLDYAKSLRLNFTPNKLIDSGYRRFKNRNFDVIVKAGNIGPDYIPGHAHADSLSFECRVNNQPFIVDPGISTYEKNEIRQRERSTSSHNTVNVNGRNSSEVWDGFRVGKRAKSIISQENKTSLSAFHNGFAQTYSRTFLFSETVFTITENICIKDARVEFHFHPAVCLNLSNSGLQVNNVFIYFEGANEVVLSEYQFCLGFNKNVIAQKATVLFNNSLTTRITI